MSCHSELERWCWSQHRDRPLSGEQNCEVKKLIRSMGANKTEKAIERASKASGGVIVEAFEKQVYIHPKSGSHTHKSSADDEKLISRDLRSLRPFMEEDSRYHLRPLLASHMILPIHCFRKLKLRSLCQQIKYAIRAKHKTYLAKIEASLKDNPKMF